MRTALPHLRVNGNAASTEPVLAITGSCQNPTFRLRFQDANPDDFCLVYLGAAQFGAAPPSPELPESGGDPYAVLRRWFDHGAAAVVLRLDWEGVFTLLSNDDESADAVFREMIEPAAPEDVDRQWSPDPATAQMFSELLRLA